MHAPPPPPPPPSSSWSSFQGDGSETSFLEALANAQLLYRHAHKLSGVSFEDFCSLTPAVRHNYLRTTLEQLDRSALYRDIAMSRFRAIPDWQSQDFSFHGLPYLSTPSNEQDCTAASLGHHQSLPLHHGNLAATPPMPLPLVDSPFPHAPPSTPVSVYNPHTHGYLAGPGEEYTWGASSSYTDSLRSSADHVSFKPEPCNTSPFRMPHAFDNLDIRGTISPQELHPELDYTNFVGPGVMMPLSPEDVGMFQLADTEFPPPVPAAPAYTARRPLPNAAPSPSGSFGHRRESVSLKTSATANGSGSGSSSNHPKRKPHGSRGSGTDSGRGYPSVGSIRISEAPMDPKHLQAIDSHHLAPDGSLGSTLTHFPRQISGFPLMIPSNSVPSHALVENQSLTPVFPSGNGESASTRDSACGKSSRSTSKKTSEKHKSSSKSSPPLRKKAPSGSNSSTSGNKQRAPSSNKQQKQCTAIDPVTSCHQPISSFPPGQNRPGFVPIGRTGMASVAQGNSHPLDLTLKKRIIVAERDAGLTYRAIKNKYTRWREAESTYRGLDRTARLPLEHRERVATWSEHHIQSLRRGMAMLRDPMRPSLKGFPWKQLADHIKAETGKPFGATTAKRKWFDIAAECEEDDSDVDDDNEGDEDGDLEMGN